MKDSPILLLDEATSALDSESESLVTTALTSNLKGKTVITIAHRLSTIRMCDIVVVLKDGQVIEQGAFDDLYDNENSQFRQLVDKQLML